MTIAPSSGHFLPIFTLRAPCSLSLQSASNGCASGNKAYRCYKRRCYTFGDEGGPDLTPSTPWLYRYHFHCQTQAVCCPPQGQTGGGSRKGGGWLDHHSGYTGSSICNQMGNQRGRGTPKLFQKSEDQVMHGPTLWENYVNDTKIALQFDL